MAPVLLCPACGAKHPLDGVDGSAFPCKGCGRTLKVPQQVPVPAAAAGADPDLPWPRASAPDSSLTHVLPTTPPPGHAIPNAETVVPKARRSRTLDPMPARWLRFLLWVIAVPLGFVIVFAFARTLGVLNSNQLEDVALAEGWNRFLPIARLLPFVALVTAGLVHLAVYGITRLRARRGATRV